MSSKVRAARRPDLNPTAASLLGFLNSFGSMTGFDLRTRVENIIGDFWNITKSQIYKELKLLADLGYVESLASGARDKQPYKITADGRDVFRAWIRQRPTAPVMRMPIVLEVFFGGEVPFHELEGHIAEMRAHHAERLRVYEGFAEQAKKGTWPSEALRLGFMFQRVMIEWLDSLPKKPLTRSPTDTPKIRTQKKPRKKR